VAERPRQEIIPAVPGPPPRRASRVRLAARRTVALAILVGGLGLLVWLATVGVGAVRDNVSPPAKPVAPVPKRLRIIFPEGFSRTEMANRITEVDRIAREKRDVSPKLDAEEYLVASARSLLPGKFAGDGKRRALEGFLFPATYDFTAKTTSQQLVAAQLKAFRRNWAKIDLRYASSKNLTPYDVLIIASMIEKEVVAPDERGRVAGVIYNRLRAGMKLGIDATIRYALGVPATESLRESQLKDPTPYNTREHVGLPPTPIANPGLASMQAAAHPAKVDYLFFVRKPDKVHHFFTASERDFINYEREHGYIK
jgi:peptidoglycan lytic transglycosylase G